MQDNTLPCQMVDVLIFGAGTAGLNARRSARDQGKSALMVDPGPFGTTCARVGCMPSKLLIAAADAVHHTQQGSLFGFDAKVTVDGARVLARVRKERDRFTGFVLRDTERHAEQGRLVVGRGRLINSHTARVSDPDGTDILEIHFHALVVATGSRPWSPPPWTQVPNEYTLDNERVFELSELPKSLLVIGPGVIGLELGQAMHRLGVVTTIVGVSASLGPLRDPRVRHVAHQTFARKFGGELDLHTDARDFQVEVRDGLVHARFRCPDGAWQERSAEKVLLAAGRRPNLEGLGLEHAGIDVRSLRYDPNTTRLGDTHVFLAGDANNDRPLLHEASDEGRIAGENAAHYPEIRPSQRRVPLSVVFSDPQMALVGMPYERHKTGLHRAGEVDYGDQGRARVAGRNKGMVRIYAERGTGRLTGAEMLGPDVEHTAHLLAWAIQAGFTVDQALEMPFYHPVVEEGIRTALRDLADQVRKDSVDCLDLPL
jgi:dihydrolipoamide dehydrogenase